MTEARQEREWDAPFTENFLSTCSVQGCILGIKVGGKFIRKDDSYCKKVKELVGEKVLTWWWIGQEEREDDGAKVESNGQTWMIQGGVFAELRKSGRGASLEVEDRRVNV